MFGYIVKSQTTCTPPAAPTVISSVNYCQNSLAVALTATGTNLLWASSVGIGSVGGIASLATVTYIDGSYNNKRINLTTNVSNVTIKTIDFFIPSYQAVNGLVLSIYNSAGVIIATSSTNTTMSANAAPIKIINTFNYTIAAAGNYSIGVSAGSGNIGSDNPSFPITETTGTINITGLSNAGTRCFNNLQFAASSSSTAPIPSTIAVGSTSYYVTQTIAGCTSTAAAITITVNASPNISQIPVANLLANYKFESNANDATGNDNGTLQNSPVTTADRFGNANKAYNFNGSTQYISTAKSYINPGDFSISIWFKTATTIGGKLIGFGTSQTGSSGQFDRHIYMNNAGQLYFGIYSSAVKTINSALSYNDNNWHLATATLSSLAGSALYIDGILVGADPTSIAGENATGYWRIGYDNINGWTSQPSSFYFSGALDDALIYQRALTSSEAQTLYRSPDGAGNNGPACSGSAVTLSASTLSGATYSWTGPNGFASALQNPFFTYSSANAGEYTLQASAGGCSSVAYTNIVSTTNAGQWTGNVSTDWATAGNWCNGAVPTATTNVVITAGVTNMPSVSSNVVCNNLIINTGATLTTTGSGILNIYGTLTNNGTMSNSGTTVFNGTTGQQTFSGVTTFYNLTLNNSNGLLLPAAIVVTNNLTLSVGVLTANNFSISVGGNWTNNVSTGAFTGGTSTVTFNGTAAQSIGGSFATGFNNLTISNTGNTVSLAANATIAGNLNVSSGTFNLSTFTANRTSAGGSLMVANNATLQIGGTNTFPINYSVNTLVVASTVEYAGTNQTVGSQTYGNLKLTSSSGAAVKTLPVVALTVLGSVISSVGTGTSLSFTATTTVNVSGSVFIGASTTFNGGNSFHTIGGNWTNNGTFNGSAGTINFSGSGAQIGGSGAQNFYNLAVTASMVSFSNVNINVASNLTTSSSGSFNQVSGGSITMSGSSKVINGSGISFNDLVISGTITGQTSFIIAGNLTVSGTLSATTGSITMSGLSKTISGTGTKSFSTLSITGTATTNANFSISSALIVSGSLMASAGTTTFIGTSTLSGIANLFNITINGTSLQLSTNSTLGIANAMTITVGTLNVTSSAPNTVNFNGTGAQNINGIAYCNLTLSNGNIKTAIANITVNNDITIGAGTTFNPSSYTHSIYEEWINNGTFIKGTSTIQFLGDASSYIFGSTIFNILTINCSASSGEILLQSNVSAAIVNMINGTIVTGEDTLTITNTRTGNGELLGNIQRTHAFTTGVGYAFESPNNIITFSSVSSVTSITVSITEDHINDFPFGSSVNEEYDISVPSGIYNATLRLDYDADELNGNNPSSMGLWHNNGSSWIDVGKTGDSTTSDYVEQSGLTDITSRWTLSNQASIVQWNGSVNTDWNTVANWTTIQGSPSMPPSSLDIVDLGTASFTYQPTINNSDSVKSMNFGSAKAVTLTLGSSGALTVLGNIDGIWSANAIHTINVNNQNLVVNGDINLSDSVNGQAINLNIGSGTVTTLGSLIESGGANINFSGTGILNVFSDFYHISGAFNAGAGTVIYNGTENQDIAEATYNNLTINKTAGIAVIPDTVNVLGNLLITSGELDNSSATAISGNVTIDSGCIFQNSNLIHVGGNWANSGSYEPFGVGTFFNGSGTQTITATTFGNLIINKPVGSSAVLTGNIVLNGDLTVTSGTLDIKSFGCDRSVQGGTLTLGDSATFIVGANNEPVNFSNGILSNSSTVIANGTGPQYIFNGTNFGNLILRNSGVKTFVSPFTVNGDLTIESGATLDAGTQTITINGNWINNGTFIPSTSTILLSGTTKNVAGNTTFKRLSVYGSYTFLNNNTIDSLLIINSTGSLIGGSSITTTMNGDLINKGILYTLGTTTFTGNVLQTLSLINAVQTVAITVNFNGSVSPVLNSTSAPQYGYLNINNTGGVNPSVGWNVLYSLTVGSGASFNCGASTHNFYGAVTNNGTITSSGVLNFLPVSAATINLGTNFTSTGRVIFGGTGAITLAGTPISFNNVNIDNTNATGITPSSNWNITNHLSVLSSSIFNAGNYNYLIGGNITNNGTINSGNSNFILNGTNTQNIYSPSAFHNLTINKTTGSTIISLNVTVNDSLNFISGKIQTATNSVIEPSGAIVTGASQTTGWVDGNLQKNIATGAGTKLFEIGDDNYYTPASIAFNNVTASGKLTAKSVAGDHPYISTSLINSTKNVNRYWSFINNGISFTTYNATFKYSVTDLDAGASSSLFGVSVYNNSWSLPVTVSASDTSSSATGITSFGDFAIGEICNRNTSISYALSPYCSASGNATVTLTGNGSGTYSSSPGLSLDSSTGLITLSTSVPGTYNVTYNIGATGSCASFITSASITITAAPIASGYYPGTPFCSGAGMAYPTGSSSGAGFLTSTTGLTIDSTTGGIDLTASTPGTYTITYTIPASGGCTVFSWTTGVTIKAAPSAVISYPNPSYHTNNTIVSINRAGSTGGIYTSAPGLSIDSLTGSVNPAACIPGIYTVTYTIAAAGGCSQYQTTTNIIIYYFSIVPNLGTAANFVLFTSAGAVGNTGISQMTGNIGSNVGAITGFETSSIIGAIHTADAVTVQCSLDVIAAYTQLNNIIPTSTTHTPAFGSGETLFAGVYSIAGAGSIAGNLTLDAQGDPNAVFIFKIGGAFTTGASTTINLINGASACNIFWKAEGAISMAASTTMRGTLIANNGAISMGAGGILEGRMFSTTGAASVYAVSASVPLCFSNTIWTGAISTNWNTPGNWLSGIIPTPTINVTIPSGLNYYPLVNAGFSSVQNITIQSNAYVTVTGGRLQIAGSISDSGTFDVSNGTIEMNGLFPQIISAGAFASNNIFNLIVSNNVILAGQQNILGSLSFGSSNDTLTTNNFLTLRSTAINTALVADITNGGAYTGNSISGNITVERYFPAHRSWRLMTAPLTGTPTIYNSWQNGGVYAPGIGTFVSGPTGGSDMDKIGNPSMFTYRTNTQTFNTVINTNVSLSPGNNGSADNTGYMIFVRGDRSVSNYILPNNNITTLSSSGKLQTGTQIFAAASVTNNYTLIGNPYASPIDFNNIILSNLIKRFYAWDPVLNTVGGFVVLDDLDNDGIFTSSVGNSTLGKDIQSSQAFFVQTMANAAASLTINESSKSSVNNNFVFRPTSGPDDLRADLYLLNADNSIVAADGAYAQFNNNYSDSVNWQDAVKFSNINEDLSFLRYGQSLAIERRPIITSADTMFLKLLRTTQRSYRFVFTAHEAQANLTGILQDSYTGIATPVNMNGVTIADFNINTVPASAAPNRFKIVFKPSLPLPVTFTSVNASLNIPVINVNWKVANEINVAEYKVERSTDGKQFSAVATVMVTGNNSSGVYNWVDKKPTTDNNFYRILSIDDNGKIQYSAVVEVVNAAIASINVYPNPVVGNEIDLQMNNVPAGIYQLRLINAVGQIIQTNTINHIAGNTEEAVLLNKKIVKGIYQLEIDSFNGKKINISIFCE